MIIIEGCDNTGKTQLQKAILERYPRAVQGYKQERPPLDRQRYMDSFWNFLGKNAEDTTNMVFDRFYYSELIYGPLLRGNVTFSEAEKRMIEKLIQSKEPLTIYCYRNPEQIVSTFEERDQLEGVQERVDTIVNLYNQTFLPMVGTHNFAIYDYSNPLSVADTWLKIDRYMDSRNYGGGRPSGSPCSSSKSW